MRARGSGFLVSLLTGSLLTASLLTASLLTVSLLTSSLTGCSGARPVTEPTPPAEHEQLRRVRSELAQTSEAFDSLSRETHLALDPALGAQLAHVRKELGWLARKAPSWQPSASVGELAEALAEHRQLLGELRQLPSAEARPLLGAVLRDLEIKSAQCRRFGGPVPVNVSVITRDIAQREVTGYEVWFVRKALERKLRAARRFDRHSSPAGRIFNEAGYYVLWAVPPGQRPDASSIARVDVEVGASQQDQVVDLTAPAAETEAGPVGVWPGAAAAGTR